MALGDLAREDDYGEPDPWTAAAERMQRKYLGRNIAGSYEPPSAPTEPAWDIMGELSPVQKAANERLLASPLWQEPQMRASLPAVNAIKHTAEAMAFPAQYARAGLVVSPETPGTLTEEDIFRADQQRRAGFNWGAKTATAFVGDPLPAGLAMARGQSLRGAMGSVGAGAGQGLGEQQPMGQLAKPFYSGVEQALSTMKQPQAPAAQWLGSLRNAPGVKPAELEQLGLEGWLGQQQGPVSKQTLADYIAANKVQLGEVTKETARVPPPGASAEAVAEYHKQRQAAPAKFGTYQLPGGENYRETLLTLPSKTPAKEVTAKKLADTYGENWSELGAYEQQRYIDEARALNERGLTGEGFRGSHWDEPNVLAHLRTNERDIGGKKTLFMEEAQSDWHQTGRKQGYQGDVPLLSAEQRQALARERNVLSFEIDQLHGQMGNRLPGETAADAIARRNAIIAQIAPIQARMDEIGASFGPAKNAVPNAPFKTTWHELALKRAIRDAAEGGFEQLAWTPGSVQNKRYPDPNRPDSAMEGFYDKMLPAAANKIGKPHGAQVGREQMFEGSPEHWEPYRQPNGLWGVEHTRSGFTSELNLPTREAAQAEMYAGASQNVHTLPITPSLREQALRKGFPMFAVPAGVLGGLAAQDQYQQ
jgi:hypothetical protein